MAFTSTQVATYSNGAQVWEVSSEYATYYAVYADSESAHPVLATDSLREAKVLARRIRPRR